MPETETIFAKPLACPLDPQSRVGRVQRGAALDSQDIWHLMTAQFLTSWGPLSNRWDIFLWDTVRSKVLGWG